MRCLSNESTAFEARQQLTSDGYEVIGVGDWATVFALPGDPKCVRLVPLDPAYRLFVDDLIAGPPHAALPSVHALLPLSGHAFAVILDRLQPADHDAAQSFCDRLSDDDALWSRIKTVEASGAALFPHLWGGLDVRPGNVLADAAGALKLIDPVCFAGQKLVDALHAGDLESLSDLTRSQIEAFTEIACFHREHNQYEGIEELKGLIARLP